jgi:hypothetical protein
MVTWLGYPFPDEASPIRPWWKACDNPTEDSEPVRWRRDDGVEAIRVGVGAHFVVPKALEERAKAGDGGVWSILPPEDPTSWFSSSQGPVRRLYGGEWYDITLQVHHLLDLNLPRKTPPTLFGQVWVQVQGRVVVSVNMVVDLGWLSFVQQTRTEYPRDMLLVHGPYAPWAPPEYDAGFPWELPNLPWMQGYTP